MVHNDNLLIIENKKSLKQEPEALKQLLKYCQTSMSNGWNENIYCVFGCAEAVKIYTYNQESKEILPVNLNLEEFLNAHFSKIETSSESLFHDLHNFIISNLKIDENNELCFLCLAVLLTTMKINIHTASDDLLFEVIQKIIVKELPELNPLIQTINPENVSILVNKLYRLYAVAGKDVYLKLYQEFCKYSKAKDEKNIVLTPEWIVKLMTNELRIPPTGQKYLSLFDPCAGTGSLIMGVNNSNCILYGCEINRKMYVLCKGLFMLSDPDFKVFHTDMFKLSFKSKFDRIITNPPYSKKLSGFHAIEFITYSIEHFLKKNGILVAIFPMNQLKTIQTHQKYKEYIFNNCDILKIINLGNCFRDASVECSILVVQRTKKPNNVTTIVHTMKFTRSIAYKVPRGSLKFTEFGKDLLNKVMNNELFITNPNDINEPSGIELQITNSEMDWTCNNQDGNDISIIEEFSIKDKVVECKSKVLKYIDQHLCESLNLNEDDDFDFVSLNEIISSIRRDMKNVKLEMKQSNFKEWKMCDLFELVSKYRKHKINDGKDLDGEYPLISASAKNNGIAKYINTFDFDGTSPGVGPKGPLESNSNDVKSKIVTSPIGFLVIGTASLLDKAGFTTYHNEKFSVTGDVKVLKPKIISSLKLTPEILKQIANYITIKFQRIYNINNKLTTEKLMSETVLVKMNRNDY
jgi:type I restriction-modification system DNA methylase subunit